MQESNPFVQPLESRRLLSGSPIAAPVVAGVSAHSFAYRLAAAAPLPQVYSIDPRALAAAKSQIAAGNTALMPAYKSLISSANSALKFAPVSVTDKTNPAGISAHDYVSYARYYWPNPKTKNGLPYIDEDGHVNQAQVDKGDDGAFGSMLNAVNNLAMAYYLSGNASYAEHAVKLIEVWFINSATKMNPNLNHAQIELGSNTGTFYGIIDARSMYALVDSLGILTTSSAWTTADRSAMKSWLTQYNTWLQTSSFGKSEAAAANNHGTWFDVQHTAILLYLGQTNAAKAVASAFGGKRIATQIKSDGSQPFELSRADAWAYSTFNLQATELMANLAERVSVNLWAYKSSAGGSIQKAITYLAPYANAKTPWPHNHLNTPLTQSDRNALIPLLLQGQKAYGGYTKWLNLLPASSVAANETQLFIDG